jgi:DnaJ-class molecular chaperone
MSFNYYEILGIEKNATNQEIRKAYKKLVIKCHPDKNIDNKEKAEEVFKKITEAYSVLSDSDKRKRYDLYGTTENSSQINYMEVFTNFMNNFVENNQEIINDIKNCDNMKEVQIKLGIYLLRKLLL